MASNQPSRSVDASDVNDGEMTNAGKGSADDSYLLALSPRSMRASSVGTQPQVVRAWRLREGSAHTRAWHVTCGWMVGMLMPNRGGTRPQGSAR